MTTPVESLTWIRCLDVLCGRLGLKYIFGEEPVYWDGGRVRPVIKLYFLDGEFLAHGNDVGYVLGVDSVGGTPPTLDSAAKLAVWTLGTKSFVFKNAFREVIPEVSALCKSYPEFGAPGSPAEMLIRLEAAGFSLGLEISNS